MTLLYEDGRQGEVNLIASRDSIVHLGNVDFENLTVNLKPKAVAAGEKAVGLGTTKAPFGDLYLQGNTLTISTKSIGITEQDGVEYLDLGSNTKIGATTITGDRLLAFNDQLKLGTMTDVAIEGVANGDILKWNKAQERWEPGQGITADNLDISKKTIGELSDVTPSVYADGMMWQYNDSLSTWKAVDTSMLIFTDFQVKGTFTVNTEVTYSTTRNFTVTAGEVVADSFDINTYRTAKYIVSCEDYTVGAKAYWTGEILLVHDGTNTSHTVYGEVEIGAISMSPTIASDIDGSNVRLKITTSSDQQMVTSHRTVCTNYSGYS